MRLDVLCSRNTCTVGSHSRHVRPIALFARSALPSTFRLQQARSTTTDHQQQHEQWQMPLLCSVALLVSSHDVNMVSYSPNTPYVESHIYTRTVGQSPVCLTWTLHILQILHATCAGSALCQNSSDSMNDFPSELSSPGEFISIAA